MGVCVVPLALSELPLAVKCSGAPLMRVSTPLRPHPPTIQLAGPDCSQCLPLPKGTSYTALCTKVCRRFRLVIDGFRAEAGEFRPPPPPSGPASAPEPHPFPHGEAGC